MNESSEKAIRNKNSVKVPSNGVERAIYGMQVENVVYVFSVFAFRMLKYVDGSAF